LTTSPHTGPELSFQTALAVLASGCARQGKSLIMPIARLAHPSDLPSLLALFEASEVSAAAQPRDRAESIWQETLTHPGVHVFVSDHRDRIAATCMLVTAPNLLRSGRRHGFLENVLTHPELRGRGHGSAVVLAALGHAWAADCHHVLLQSGRADPRVHAFYEGLGLRPGLRVAFVAIRPTQPRE
jgi:GNAT superfamily N-acetyltransferase